MNWKRIACAALAAVMAAGSASALAGCKKKQTAVKTVVDHVYRATFVEMPEELNYIQQLAVSGDKILAIGNYYDRTTYTREKRVYEVDPAAKTMTRIEAKGLERLNENSYTQDTLFASDGSLWRVDYDSVYDEKTQEYSENYYLTHVAADGSQLCSVEGRTFWGEDSGDEDNRVWHSMNYLTEWNGGVVFMDNSALYSVASDGSLRGKLDVSAMTESGYIQQFFVAGGALTMLHADYSGSQTKLSLVTADMDAGKLGAPVELDQKTFRNVWNMFTGEGYSIYYNDDEAIYGYDAATGTSEKVMDFLNSDVGSNLMNGNMQIISRDRFITSGYDDVTGKQVVAILDRVPDDQIVPKYVMTVATLGDAWSLRSNMIRFNRQSDEYRFTIRSYSPDDYYDGGDDYDYQSYLEQALTALNNDIIGGNVPDVLVVDEKLPMENYVSKGLFLDLYKLMDEDETIRREDFLENILAAFETNGKLYEIAPTFWVSTLAAKNEMLGGRTGWTMAEFIQWADSLPEGTRPFYDMTRDALLEMFCTYAYEEFVDPATGNCFFDTDEFKNILKYANSLSNESIWDQMNNSDGYNQEFWENYDNRYRANLAVLEQTGLYNFNSYRSLMSTFFTDEITLIGLPSADKNGSAVSRYQFSFAISSKSPVVEGAWAFVRYFLTADYQDSNNGGFPLRISSLEKMADQAIADSEEEKKNREENPGDYDGGIAPSTVVVGTTEETTAAETDGEPAETELIDANGDGVIDASDKDVVAGGDIDIAPDYPMTQDERYYIDREKADALIAFLKSLNHVTRNNTSVNAIIKEEAGAYFAGQKSLDETAKIIQNRVFTYVSERR